MTRVILEASSTQHGRDGRLTATRGRSPGAALLWALLLSGYFMVVYNGCTWATAVRDHRHPGSVGTFYFAWERHIPFVPLMIVPYWSIDLFFFAAPFLCTNRAELRTHVKRVLLAITVAGACFLLLPLKMGAEFATPRVDGVLAPMFRSLAAFTPDYNLAPSLHIALRALLWAVIARHTRGLPRQLLRGWFVLIALSTLLAWMHHAIDVVTGQLLGIACLCVFPEVDACAAGDGRRAPRNWRVAGAYALAAATLIVLAALLRSWGWLFLWPGVAMAALASAHVFLGPTLFRKTSGRLPLSTRAILFPYLLCDQVALLHYRRHGNAYDMIAPGLLLGRRLSRREARRLIEHERVSAVLDLSAEFAECPLLTRAVAYRSLPVLDMTPPSKSQLQQAVAFIRAGQRDGGVVYVHCTMGFSRSACVAAAYLLDAGIAADVDDAVARVRAVRPQTRLGRGALRVLQEFNASLRFGGGPHWDAAAPQTG